jgi:hypothetical protein
MATRKQAEKTPQAERWAIARASESPDAFAIADDGMASGPRVHRAPGVPHALSQEGGNATDDGAPAPQTMGVMTHV